MVAEAAGVEWMARRWQESIKSFARTVESLVGCPMFWIGRRGWPRVVGRVVMPIPCGRLFKVRIAVSHNASLWILARMRG